MKIRRFYLLLIVTFLILCGCMGKSPLISGDDNDKKNENNKIQAKNIAVLPVENNNADSKTSPIFRARLLEELYFKGYPKLPLEMIDKKLESLYVNTDKKTPSVMTPQALKDLGADAGMYCSLTENNKSKIFYAPIKISARCELRSVQTGEILWKAQSESTETNFDFTNKGLEKKSHDNLETVIDDAVNKLLKTLPDGPNLQG
jgi:hypothetical protein